MASPRAEASAVARVRSQDVHQAPMLLQDVSEDDEVRSFQASSSHPLALRLTAILVHVLTRAIARTLAQARFRRQWAELMKRALRLQEATTRFAAQLSRVR